MFPLHACPPSRCFKFLLVCHSQLYNQSLIWKCIYQEVSMHTSMHSCKSYDDDVVKAQFFTKHDLYFICKFLNIADLEMVYLRKRIWWSMDLSATTKIFSLPVHHKSTRRNASVPASTRPPHEKVLTWIVKEGNKKDNDLVILDLIQELKMVNLRDTREALWLLFKKAFVGDLLSTVFWFKSRMTRSLSFSLPSFTIHASTFSCCGHLDAGTDAFSFDSWWLKPLRLLIQRIPLLSSEQTNVWSSAVLTRTIAARAGGSYSEPCMVGSHSVKAVNQLVALIFAECDSK